MKTKVIENKWKKIKESLFLNKGSWSNFKEFSHITKYKVSNHITNNFTKPVLFPILDVENYLPKFKKYNPVNRLFLLSIIPNIKKKKSYKKSKSIYDEDNEEENEAQVEIVESGESDNQLNNIEEEEVKVDVKSKLSNFKSQLFYGNNELFDFMDNYLDLEKHYSFLQLFNVGNYDPNKLPTFSISQIFVDNFINKNSNAFSYEVCKVSLTHHSHGHLLISATEIYYIKNFPYETTQCTRGLFLDEVESYKFGKKIIMKIPIDDVKQIHKRRYYYKNNSLEIFTFQSKSYFFNFDSDLERDKFW